MVIRVWKATTNGPDYSANDKEPRMSQGVVVDFNAPKVLRDGVGKDASAGTESVSTGREGFIGASFFFFFST